MRAARDDAPVVQHQDQVGAAHGAQAVGDDEGGAALHQPVERLLDQLLGLGVHAGGGVVEDQDARVDQQGAGDGDALLLPAGERRRRARRPGCRSPRACCMMKSCAWAALAAATISASVASGRPKAMFSRIVAANRVVSCRTMPIWLRSELERHVADVVPVDQ